MTIEDFEFDIIRRIGMIFKDKHKIELRGKQIYVDNYMIIEQDNDNWRIRKFWGIGSLSETLAYDADPEVIFDALGKQIFFSDRLRTKQN